MIPARPIRALTNTSTRLLVRTTGLDDLAARLHPFLQLARTDLHSDLAA